MCNSKWSRTAVSIALRMREEGKANIKGRNYLLISIKLRALGIRTPNNQTFLPGYVECMLKQIDKEAAEADAK